MVIAVGTNNLFKDSAKIIESTIASAYVVAKDKFPAADIYIYKLSYLDYR